MRITSTALSRASALLHTAPSTSARAPPPFGASLRHSARACRRALRATNICQPAMPSSSRRRRCRRALARERASPGPPIARKRAPTWGVDVSAHSRAEAGPFGVTPDQASEPLRMHGLPKTDTPWPAMPVPGRCCSCRSALARERAVPEQPVARRERCAARRAAPAARPRPGVSPVTAGCRNRSSLPPAGVRGRRRSPARRR